MITFLFDFDSTVFPDETMTEILTHCLENDPGKEAKAKEIADTCAQAMNGEISELESTRRRLGLVHPTPEKIAEYVAQNKTRFDPKIKKLIEELQQNHQVLIISGGFKECLIPLCEGFIRPEDIYANEFPVDFFERGNIEDIQPFNKRKTINGLKKAGKIRGQKTVMIGDGITDFWVYEEGVSDDFVGVGIYAVRPEVQKKAPIFFTDLDKLCAHLAGMN